MSSNSYKLIGYGVWHGGKWYVRRKYLSRLPSARQSIAAATLVTLSLGGAVLVARRAMS